MTLHAELCRRAAWVLGRAISTCLLLAMALTPTTTAASPQVKLRVVGGLAGLNQYVQHEEPFWSQELARLSGAAVLPLFHERLDDGRYRIDAEPWEAGPSQWVYPPQIIDTRSGQCVFAFEDPRWSMDRAVWVSDTQVELTLRKYPGHATGEGVRARIECAAKPPLEVAFIPG